MVPKWKTALPFQPHDTIITNRRLPREASIFTAELTAMIKAMKWIELQGKMTDWRCIQNILRFEKCAGVLGRLKSPTDKYHKNERLKKRGIRINFCWVAAHVGVLGNEFADEVARTTANEDLRWDTFQGPHPSNSAEHAGGVAEAMEWNRENENTVGLSNNGRKWY